MELIIVIVSLALALSYFWQLISILSKHLNTLPSISTLSKYLYILFYSCFYSLYYLLDELLYALL